MFFYLDLASGVFLIGQTPRQSRVFGAFRGGFRVAVLGVCGVRWVRWVRWVYRTQNNKLSVAQEKGTEFNKLTGWFAVRWVGRLGVTSGVLGFVSRPLNAN